MSKASVMSHIPLERCWNEPFTAGFQNVSLGATDLNESLKAASPAPAQLLRLRHRADRLRSRPPLHPAILAAARIQPFDTGIVWQACRFPTALALATRCPGGTQ